MLQILSMHALYREQPVFTIDRPNGRDDITFLHFLCEMDILVDGKTNRTGPGAALFYAPKTPQWFCGKSPVVHNWMHISASSLPRLAELGIECDKIYCLPDSSFITDIFQKIETEMYILNNGSAEIAEHYFDIFLLQFSRAAKNPAQKHAGKLHEDLVLLRSYIRCEYASGLTVADLALRIGMSQSRFFEVYRKTFHVTPVQDIINTRIENAGRLLAETDFPVSEIAFRCGYSNLTHFNRQFKGAVGITPSEYRNKCKNTAN